MTLAYILLGLVAGVFGGMFGIGGGAVMIPAMVYFFGLTQHQAQGTTLAIMVPPIGLLAAWRYYQSGNVKLGMAALICAGFVVGGWLGAHFVQNLPETLMKRLFGGFLLLVALKMIFSK
ncbi:MAG TPA: sulfite exporter TauE/SafE family protein [Candidatus Omnitrophota bacterium]|nr:sulfite exporter TauE/SafE family protein [Candidatus Omnitrophota bacterium]HPS36610.1 sulfite exporter TauE/SafE family protein [Candidatus Omnitrophota bacterium]